LILEGVLESGDVTRVILGIDPFPVALVTLKKPVDQPKRVFGFDQASSNAEKSTNG
jgi:hypothetical protein